MINSLFGFMSADKPLTVSQLTKILSFCFVIISIVMSLAWFVASIKNDVTEIHNTISTNKNEELILQSEFEQRINALERRTDENSRNIDTIKSKLDVSITILQRIDDKVNGPTTRPFIFEDVPTWPLPK